MAKSLSIDLRERVIAVIDGSVSRRQAATRFGVSVSSAIRWHALALRSGDATPKRQGGDRRSGRIEAHAGVILDAVAKQSDITLAELRDLLAGRGVSVGIATLWRFFARRKITLKKSPGMRPSRIVPMS